MKRAEFYKKINRNNSEPCFNRTPINQHLQRNDISSDFDIDQIWLDDDEITPRAEILELNSSDDPRTPSGDKDKPKSTWSHIYPDHQSAYDASGNARRQRTNRYQYTTNNFFDAADKYENDVLFGYYGSESNNVENNVKFNHQLNCFTVIDKRFMVSSDSSSDEYVNVDKMNKYDLNDDNTESYNYYEQDTETAKRTIWIYSFKNKRLLSENDMELVNIPSGDVSSTSCSIDDTEEPTAESLNRVATPIPLSYVPRLLLPTTPTLPTVTEVTEPNRKSSSRIDKSSNSDIQLKPKNNWILSENDTNAAEKNISDKSERSTNVINWMALSPREKRRTFRNLIPTIEYLSPLQGISTERSLVNCVESDEKSPSGQNGNDTRKEIVKEIRAMVETKKDSIGISKSTQSTARTVIKVEDYVDKATETDREYKPKYRDYNYKKHEKRRRSQIRFSPKIFDIKERIENLGDNSINVVRESDIKARNCADSGSTFLIRNMLLQPKHWTDYLPAGSLPSLQSSSAESDLEPQSLLRRLAKCFLCFK